MIARLRFISICATTALITACSSPFSHSHVRPQPFDDESSPRVTVSTHPFAADDQAAVHLHVPPDQLHNENSWNAPRYTVQWPSFPDAAEFTSALQTTVAAWRSDFVSDAGSSPNADLSVAWEPVVDAASMRGVRLTERTTGGDTATRTDTLYGTTSEAWHSPDLIAPAKRSAVLAALQTATQHDAHVTPVDDADPTDVLSDLSFDSHGTMLVRIPDGAIAPMSAGHLYAEVSDPETYLSDAGRRVRAATLTHAASSSPTSSPPITSTRQHTDCSAVKCIALTFDDGPGASTDSVLDTLESKHAKATFFMLGPAVQAAPQTVRRMASLGMGLGDHSWTHPQFTHLSADQVTQEITRQADAVQQVTGQKPIAVRPPFGAFDAKTPHAGYPFVLWDVDTEDWKNRSAPTTTQRALAGAHRGAIVLMHDIHPSTAKALPGLIDALQKQGYTLVTIDDLIPHMKPTDAYYSADDDDSPSAGASASPSGD